MKRFWMGMAAAGVFGTVVISGLAASPFDPSLWPYEHRSRHFILYYRHPHHQDLAKQIVHAAEKIYRKAGETYAFKRYDDFWTWDDRTRIYLYEAPEDFYRETGQPPWSRGFADADSLFFSGRTIVTFAQDGGRLQTILPHEIGHLLWDDLCGNKNTPLWMSEGVAQNVDGSWSGTPRVLKALVVTQQSFSWADIAEVDAAQLKQWPAQRIAVFYAQSASMMDYLIAKGGQRALRQFCERTREGKSWKESFFMTYGSLWADGPSFIEAWKTFVLDASDS